MTDEINYQNNPLHGLGLKGMLTEIVDHYGFELLYAYLGINSFNTNASVDSSVKFLKKTQWAREKVEAFYLYKFKSLPKVFSDQYELPPRDRIIPEGQNPGEPSELSLDDAENLREKREQKAADHDAERAQKRSERAPSKYKAKPMADRPTSAGKESPVAGADGKLDPWANSRNKLKG